MAAVSQASSSTPIATPRSANFSPASDRSENNSRLSFLASPANSATINSKRATIQVIPVSGDSNRTLSVVLPSPSASLAASANPFDDAVSPSLSASTSSPSAASAPTARNRLSTLVGGSYPASLVLQSPTASSKPPRPTTGFFSLAVAAIDRTQSAIAIAEQKIRPRQSQGRLSTANDGALSLALADQSQPEKPSLAAASSAPTTTGPAPVEPVSPLSFGTRVEARNSAILSQSALAGTTKTLTPLSSQPAQSTYSRPYSQADASLPQPIRLPRFDSKMHQTSSRLLRMTDDDRPFTKDFKDLFATLIVSLLPLTAHRVRLTKIEHTFLSEDAINNLGSLKFSQSNRMPDPKDPSRIVTTTTTTTFSMAKDMARSICQRFLEARFIESADGKYQQVYSMKGSVWQLTPKGIAILDSFCARNGIQQKQVVDLIGNQITQLVLLERDSLTDKIVNDKGTIEVIFRRFIGVNGLNVKANVSNADADSLSDYRDGLTGVKMASERRINGKLFRDSFTGKSASDWLMDCCTTIDRREANEIASLFVENGLIETIQADRSFLIDLPGSHIFQPTKIAIYQLSAKGRDIINGTSSRGRSSDSDGGQAQRSGIARDSNTQRLDKILSDAALRLLFRENLRDTHCEENLSFYLDVDDFVRNCRQAIRATQKNPGAASMDGIKETMAQAYGIYNAFLAPGSPCELNIDHQLRNNLATRMTKAVGQDGAMIDTLREVTSLFEDAQNAVFKLMASDSVPKFLRHPKYENTLRNYDFDAIVVGGNRAPERSQSRSIRK